MLYNLIDFIILPFIAYMVLLGCNNAGKEKQEEKIDTLQVSAHVSAKEENNADTGTIGNSQTTEDTATVPRETRLRYSGFTIVFHDFKGYEAEAETKNGKRRYSCQFGGGSDGEAELNDDEKDSDDYIETLVVRKDTLHISEFLFDDRINNTLIQILPSDSADKFKISYCYLSGLNEIIDYRKHSQKELEKLVEAAIHINEQTDYHPIKDSAGFYFRAMPHTPDMMQVTVANGKVVPVKAFTQEQIDWERNQYVKEFERIKKKYSLKDTTVVIPGEYDVIATLTKDKKLFDYDYDSFLFRIERYNNNKLIETKYIVVAIGYGC